jgi:hypothetical protein
MTNPLDKATDMFFAINPQGEVYAAGWDVPEWNTKLDFSTKRKEHRNSVIRRVHKDSEEFKDLMTRFRE